jgi:hypothetical protein
MMMDLSRGKAYADQMQERLAGIKQRLGQAGIDSLVITPEDDIGFKIREFMAGNA